MSDQVSANTDDLATFVSSGRTYAGSLRQVGEHLGRLRSSVSAQIGSPPGGSAEPKLLELIDWVVVNNEYVEAIHDALRAFDLDLDAQVTVDASVVEMGLAEAGFSGPINPSTASALASLADQVRGDGLDADGGVLEAAAAYRQIVSEIDKGDDLGMSNGELNRVQSELDDLDADGRQIVFGLLSDGQLEVLFHNVHSSGRSSNDWNDDERDEFYDIVWGLDQATRDRLAPHSPWVEVGAPSRDASEARALVIAAIDEGDDAGMSNGELNRVQSILAGLGPDEAAYVFDELSSDQLEVLFDNAHGSGAWSNDWDDPERDEFYDVVYGMDPAAIDRLAPHSPWIQIGSPSREAARALGIAERSLGDGTSFDVSVGEMDAVAASIEGLSVAEFDYVFGNLSDDQLEVLIHNAHPTGWWSNDWSDDQREAFFDSFDAYLDDLIASGTYEAAPGAFPTAAETDNMILTLLPADYTAVPAGNGQQADGNLAIVDEFHFALARGRSSGIPVADNLNGFADRGRGQQWVRADGGANYGTPIHEALHFYSDPQFRRDLSSPLNEGVTEYFTRTITDQLDDPATTTVDEAAEIAHDRRNIYSENLAFSERLVVLVDEDVVAEAFFEGNTEQLRLEYQTATGRTEAEWDSMIEHVRNEEWADANNLLTPATP